MPSDLTPAVKEERQVERLIDKETAPSRKTDDIRGPKHDNRRRRMKVEDSDVGQSDPDLSLSTVLAIAARIAMPREFKKHNPSREKKDLADKKDREREQEEKAEKDKTRPIPLVKPKAPADPKAPKTPKPTPEEAEKAKTQKRGEADKARSEKRQQTEAKRADKILGELSKDFGSSSAQLGQDVLEYGTKHLKGKPLSEVQEWASDQKTEFARYSKVNFKGNASVIIDKVSELWPTSDPSALGQRAGIVDAVVRAMDRIGLPKSFANVFKRDPKAVAKDKDLILQIIAEAGRTLSRVDLQNDDFVLFAALSAAYEVLRNNPPDLDRAKLESRVDSITSAIYDKARQVLSVAKWMDEWKEVMEEHHFSKSNEKDFDEFIQADEFYGKMLQDAKSFFGRSDPVFNPGTVVESMEEAMKEQFGAVPKEVHEMAEQLRAASSIATSYDAASGKAMPHKTASYHGVLQQGHPSGPTNTGYKSYDKRYFGKEHYDSIVAAAKELMQEDWLKHGWEGGAKDAPFRAALDLAIQVANQSLYQAKIDAETYDMLLNRLAGWKHDQFAETVLPGKDGANRSASAMSKTNIQNFLRIASELRHSNPRAALEIVKTVRTMRANEEAVAQATAPVAQAPAPVAQQEQVQQQEQIQQEQAPMVGQQECLTQEQQQGNITDKDTDAFVEGKLDIKDLKDKTKKLVDSKDVEDFVDGLKDLSEVLKKTAAGRTARIATMMDLEGLIDALEGMNPEEGSALINSLIPQAKELEKALTTDDIEGFMKGLDSLFSETENAAKHVKTGSVRVSLSTLVRLAHSVPAARAAILPILAAAKKKKDKKKSKKKPAKKPAKKDDKKGGKKPNPFAKKDGKKPGGKKPPFGGKKAPPFGGKKAPPFGGKKASVVVASEDSEW